MEKKTVSTVMLNGIVPYEHKPTKIGDYDGDGILDLMVKFDRTEITSLLSVGVVTLTVYRVSN